MSKKEFDKVLKETSKMGRVGAHGRALALLRWGEITVAQFDKIMRPFRKELAILNKDAFKSK